MDFSDQVQRWERAEQQGAELGAAIQSWVAASPLGYDAHIADDRLSWELRLKVSNNPPLEQWGLMFGEAVHHLRALLDNLVVAVAKDSGVNSSGKLKRLSFPITATADEWKDGQSRVAALPTAYKDAIKNLQPFNRLANGGTLDQDLLLVLRDLDNRDKHHLQVKPSIEKSSLEHQMTIEFESEAGAIASEPPQVVIFDAPFEDGAVMTRHTTAGRIAKVRGQFGITAQVRVDLPDGRQAGLTEILANICYYTGVVVNYLASVEAAYPTTPQ